MPCVIMTSGSQKRKAAKEKKQKELEAQLKTNNEPAAISQENTVVKKIDDGSVEEPTELKGVTQNESLGSPVAGSPEHISKENETSSTELSLVNDIVSHSLPEDEGKILPEKENETSILCRDVETTTKAELHKETANNGVLPNASSNGETDDQNIQHHHHVLPYASEEAQRIPHVQLLQSIKEMLESGILISDSVTALLSQALNDLNNMMNA